MTFAVEFNTMRLYNGKRSIWLAFELCGRRWWLSRWDSARVAANNPGIVHRGREMTTYCGRRKKMARP